MTAEHVGQLCQGNYWFRKQVGTLREMQVARCVLWRRFYCLISTTNLSLLFRRKRMFLSVCLWFDFLGFFYLFYWVLQSANHMKANILFYIPYIKTKSVAHTYIQHRRFWNIFATKINTYHLLTVKKATLA